jgi:hypothetical protein
MTGIPAIRKYLRDLPAEQNLKDYERHINTAIPAFIDKIKRTVGETKRDGGFRVIAEEFDRVRQVFMTRLLTQAKRSFQTISGLSMARMINDIPTFKERIEEFMTEDWFALKSGAWKRILKMRGTIPKGVSKAKGLEECSNWNKDLSAILAPGFHRWSKAYTEQMKAMPDSLRMALDQLHTKTTLMMSNCATNMVTVERAQKKWAPMRLKLKVKLPGLTDETTKLQQRILEWATMAFDCENNVVSNIADEVFNEVFDEVFNSAPALKPPNPKHKRPMKQYVTPKLKI